MTIRKIYEELQIPENLQNHMLWVAGLAKEIHNHWIEPELDETVLLQVCLFHDIAKVLSFSQRDAQTEKVYKRLVDAYGKNEHQACNKICEKYKLAKRVLEIIKNNNIKPFIRKAKYVLESNDYEHKIMRYADSRVAPTGVTSLENRRQEFLKRNPDTKPDLEAIRITNDTEKQIQNNMSKNPNLITHEDCEKHREYLLNLEI